MVVIMLVITCCIRQGTIPLLTILTHVLPTYTTAPHQQRPAQADDVESGDGDHNPQTHTLPITNRLINDRMPSMVMGDIELGECSVKNDGGVGDGLKKTANCEKCNRYLRGGKSVNRPCTCANEQDDEDTC